MTPSILVVGCAILVGLDTFRLGFFADDFHFLDVARRMPTLDVLLGRYGVWPWYRPLSRELYFWLAAAAGPGGLAVARGLSVACFAGAALLIYRLGLRLMSPTTAAAGALLFVTCSLSKFLVAWASGFQDMLATLLTVGAVLAQASGRRNRALALAALAPFAKESGFLAAPLVVAWSVIVEGKRRFEPWMARQAAVALGAFAVHAVVRNTWGSVVPTEVETHSADLSASFLDTLASFVTARVPHDAWVWLAGAAVGACAAWLLIVLRTHSGEPRARNPVGGFWFLVVAGLVGIGPVLAMQVVRLHSASSRFLYPAVPWLSLLLAKGIAQLPAFIWRPALVALVLVNAWGLGYQQPDFDAEGGWKTGPLDWSEAQRIWGRTQRLGIDLRARLAARPESVVVLYADLPYGSWFQTEDGPATRELLGDPRAKSYFLNQAPRDIPPGRMAMMVYDPVVTHHLQLFPRDPVPVLTRSVGDLMQGRSRAAFLWARYCAPEGLARFYRPYLQAAAMLGEEGPASFASQLEAGKLFPDTLTSGLALRESFAGSPNARLARALAIALSRPMTATVHLECADSLVRCGAQPLAGAELWIASRLAPAWGLAHARLGLFLAQNGLEDLARPELKEALALGIPDTLVAATRSALTASDTAPGGTRARGRHLHAP